jgi:hypothetical protein
MWLLLILVAECPDISRYLLLRAHVPEARTVVPEFPKGLKTGPDGARVVLEVEVDREGLPRRSRVVEGRHYATLKSSMTAIFGWRFGPSNGPALRAIQVLFVYRSMPAGTPMEELGPVHRGQYEIEVRGLEDAAAEQGAAADERRKAR